MRFRSSLMCSMSGIRPSGLAGLGARRSRRSLVPAGPVAAGPVWSAGVVISWAGSERLVAGLGLKQRHALHGRAVTGRLLLQFLELPLQVLDLLLGGVRLRRGLLRRGRLGRSRECSAGRPRGQRLAAVLVGMQALGLGLED